MAMYPLCFSASVCCALSLQASPEALEDHPRPDWARPWVSLNGEWRFDFDPDDAGLRERWFEGRALSRTIRVPFPWQSELSCIHDTEYQGAVWYERDVVIPADAGPRIYIVFGAVDWHAMVWVNGVFVAEHEGGYTPFEVELTERARPGDTVRVTVRAYDATDPETPNGKQTGWYTRTGGIWQTVYLESRGRGYLERARIVPDIDAEQALFSVDLLADAPGDYVLHIEAETEGRARHGLDVPVQLEAGAHTIHARLPVPNPQLWSPDSPALYDATLRLLRSGEEGGKAEDTVRTYFGMRKISSGPYDGSGHEYILLNNKPIYLRGALHQSFNPQGIYTHPDEDYIRRDYEKAKEFGLNFLRIHIKVDEPRCLYWADRLGILLMCDMPNYQRHTARSQLLWEATLRETITRDFNHPSIFAWCCFNETWGLRDEGYDRAKQEWVRDMYRLAKHLDPTRLVEDNSPCRYDHVETDINSWHFYIDRYERARDHIAEVVAKTFPGSQFNYAEGWTQSTAPLINSEYGGVGAGSGDRDISWVFLFLTNLLRKYGKICGYVYTELEDIEWEHNGFMNYDRSDKEYHYPAGITLADLQHPDFPVLDCPPYVVLAPHERRISIPVLVSHWTERDGLESRMSVCGETVEGEPWDRWIPSQQKAVSARPYCVEPQGCFDIEIPDRKGLLFVVVEVMEEGKRLGANYCVINVEGNAFVSDSNTRAVSVSVHDISAQGFQSFLNPSDVDKVWGFGSGFIEYSLTPPGDVLDRPLTSCQFIAEIGAKADAERLDWPERRHPDDYPQTDGRKWPTDIVFSLNGVPFHRVTVGDDFADARGVLSHAAHFHHGSHGEVVRAPVTGEALDALREALKKNERITVRIEAPPDADHIGGLAVYGQMMGMIPLDPTLLFKFEDRTSTGK